MFIRCGRRAIKFRTLVESNGSEILPLKKKKTTHKHYKNDIYHRRNDNNNNYVMWTCEWALINKGNT